ncbi:MAG TPA: DUF4249 family protein [Cyclobacteriaceae bacterium]|nr:DUF4249 family protein [Cyclobacteriaceae bacterium]
MHRFRSISIVLILLCAACVDRIIIDTGTVANYAIVIDGFISDQPGPYTIQVTKAFDIESKQSIKTPINLKKLTISDNVGNKEDLSNPSTGVYRTAPNGIRGVVGRAYKIHLELLDGRIYESVPDTLQSAGSIDKVYTQFREDTNTDGSSKYGFDVLFNSTAGSKKSYFFLWKFVGTFQAETVPSLHTETCGESTCPRPPACSGFNTSLEQIGPCTCCSCWYDFFNTELVLSEGQFVKDGVYNGVQANYVPVNQWTFLHKVHAEVQQFSLSRQAYEFWKGVKAQKSASSSLFQPITGKVSGNFVQISGPEAPIDGLFYATSIVKASIFITRDDVPLKNIIPDVSLPFTDDCRKLFPNATTTRPAYWTD